MISRLRKRITYANVGVTIAIVFALTGGAYAAKRYLITSTAQISPKVLKSLHGKEGSQGPAGPAGKDGVNGKDGLNGKDGAAGESVTEKTVNSGETECEKRGGSSFKVGAATTFACNGKEGKEGPEGSEGSPWTAGGTLPAGKTETGVWSFGITSAPAIASISFSLPLAKALAAAQMHYVTSATTECPGSVSAPSAQSGNLCVYQGALAGQFAELFAPTGGPGSGTSGAVAVFVPTSSSPIQGFGSWAVTG